MLDAGEALSLERWNRVLLWSSARSRFFKPQKISPCFWEIFKTAFPINFSLSAN